MCRIKRKMPYLMYERMSECFEELGWTDKEVGKYIGRERKIVGEYRRGDTVPDAHTLMCMCCLFKVSADWMLGLSNRKKPVPEYYEVDI